MLKLKYLLVIIIILSIQFVQAQTVFRLGSDSVDYGKDIVLDGNGNIILAGHFYGTVNFDPGSNVHNLTANGYIDNFIAKYSKAGIYKWAVGFGGVGEDSPNSVKTDTNNNIYVCGYFSNQVDFDPGPGTAIRTSNGLKDAYIAKYDSSGNFLWVNTFGADSNDEACDLKLDKNGNLYVTGYFQKTISIDTGAGTATLTSNGSNDIFVVKYNSNGHYIWGFNIGSTLDDEGMAIAIDTSGNCYVSGSFSKTVDFDPSTLVSSLTSFGGTDIFLAKYSSDGLFQWANQMGGGKGAVSIFPGGITLDAQQNVFITGGFNGTMQVGEGSTSLSSKGKTDVFIVKCSAQGVFQSSFSFGGSGDDKGYRIGVDLSGLITVAGSFQDTVNFDPGTGQHIVVSKGTHGASDIFIAKYTLQPALLWVNSVGAITANPSNLSLASSIAIDNIGNCFATGRFYSTADFDPGPGIVNLVSAGVSDIFVVAYDLNGYLTNGSGSPAISIVPRSLNFGTVSLDTSKQMSFHVFNVGTADLIISNAASSNLKFTVTPTNATLLPDQAQEFIVHFAPIDSFMQTGWIILDHNANNGKDSIAIQGVGTFTVMHVNYPMISGWNMISVPLIMSDPRKIILFPGATSDAYTYTNVGYIASDSLQKSNGYWLKFDTAQSIRLYGDPIIVDTMHVKSGWNLIGSISFPVLIGSIIQEPINNVASSYFEYSGSYKDVLAIAPGKAYWVKVNQDGILILRYP